MSHELTREQIAESLCKETRKWSRNSPPWVTMGPTQKAMFLVLADWVLARETKLVSENASLKRKADDSIDYEKDLRANLEKFGAMNIEALGHKCVDLTARITELEQALRLHLAVSPDDPLLLTPVERQVVMLTTKVAEVERERDGMRLYAQSMQQVADNNYAMWQSHKESLEIMARELAASEARVAKLEEQVTRFAMYVQDNIEICWAGANPDATEQAAIDWLTHAALSQDGVQGKEQK